jgi:hypothetical protein
VGEADIEKADKGRSTMVAIVGEKRWRSRDLGACLAFIQARANTDANSCWSIESRPVCRQKIRRIFFAALENLQEVGRYRFICAYGKGHFYETPPNIQGHS